MNSFLTRSTPQKARFIRALATGFGLGISSLLMTGCDGLLDVETPGVIGVDAWDDPASAPLLVNAAIGDFECMLPSYIRSTGTIAHELQVSGILGVWQNWGARRDILRNDSGSCAPGTVGIYNPLQDARYMADEGYRRVSDFSADQVDGKEGMLATLAAYAGYSYTLMGEAMCESAIDGGPLVTREELWRIAEDRFTAALAHAQAANNTSIHGMALVGRARVRLNLGDVGGALADAEAVPVGFIRNATYSFSDNRRRNTIWVDTHENDHWSVHPAYRDLSIDGIADPRVLVTDMGRLGVDNLTPQFRPEKYSSISSPIPIARWEEAQLIIAEIEGGQIAVDAINRLRSNAGLPLFSSTNEEEIQAQVIEERRRELFLEGHRLNDMIRYGIPFPTGVTHKDQPYGNATCVPLPDAERNANENIP